MYVYTHGDWNIILYKRYSCLKLIKRLMRTSRESIRLTIAVCARAAQYLYIPSLMYRINVKSEAKIRVRAHEQYTE